MNFLHFKQNRFYDMKESFFVLSHKYKNDRLEKLVLLVHLERLFFNFVIDRFTHFRFLQF